MRKFRSMMLVAGTAAFMATSVSLPQPAFSADASVCQGYAQNYARKNSRGPILGGAAIGAVGGVIIGGIVGGPIGAAAAIGGAVGGAVGGGKRARDYNTLYADAYAQCMSS